MRKYNIIHFGIGNVGKMLIEQIFANREKLKRDFGIDLQYCGLFGSKGGFFKEDGFSQNDIAKMSEQLSHPEITDPSSILKKFSSTFLQNTIFIDTTTSAKMFPIISFGLEKGAYVVLSNKKPLAGPLKEFKELQKLGGRRFAYETTVGAGLPVIRELKELLATGDEVIEISGCFSGTLGFICSSLESGMLFSQSVILAKEKGFTEYDPREDLSGADVARKAIILARLLGKKIEMEDLIVESLFPKSYSAYSVLEFMERVHELDSNYTKLFRAVLKKQMTMRYIASVSQKKVSVKLTEVLQNSPLGSLNGSDNMIVFKTKRYYDTPMVIQGPGAGLEVTAAGVFGDILSLIAI